MTVSVVTARTSAVAGTGAAQAIPFTFPITANSDVTVVTKLVASPYTQTTLSETTHYTVTNNGTAGGSITTVTPFVSSAYTIQIIRVTPLTQLLDLINGGTMDAETLELELDKLARGLIDLDDRITVYLAGAAGIVAGVDYQEHSNLLDTLATAPTNTYIAVGNGTTWVSSTPAQVMTALGFSTFFKTLVDDASATTARSTLNAVGVADVICTGDAVVCSGNEMVTN